MTVTRNYTGHHVLTYGVVDTGEIEIVITRENQPQTGTYVNLSRWDAFWSGIGIAWTAAVRRRQRGRALSLS